MHDDKVCIQIGATDKDFAIIINLAYTPAAILFARFWNTDDAYMCCSHLHDVSNIPF